MRTFLLLAFGCFISSGALLASTTMKNPFIGFAIAGFIWLLILKKLNSRG